MKDMKIKGSQRPMLLLMCLLITNFVCSVLVSQEQVSENVEKLNVSDEEGDHNKFDNALLSTNSCEGLESFIKQLDEGCKSIVDLCKIEISHIKKNMVNGRETLRAMIVPEGIFRKKKDYVVVQHHLRDLQHIFGEIEKMYVSSKNMIGAQKIFCYFLRDRMFKNSLHTLIHVYIPFKCLVTSLSIVYIAQRKPIEAWEKFMLLTINCGKLIYEIEQKQFDAFREKEKCPVDKRLRRQLRKIKKKLKKQYNKLQKTCSKHQELVFGASFQYNDLLYAICHEKVPEYNAGHNDNKVKDEPSNPCSSNGMCNEGSGSKTTVQL